MKKLLYIARYPAFAVLLLLLQALAPAIAQNVVYQGETSPLAVDEVPGYSYEWELYSDGTVNLATVPGNCPITSADFVGGNIGATVNVKWIKPGIYYFKMTVWDASGCGKNIEIGEMEVLEAKPTAVVTPPDPEGVCAGETYMLEVVFTGTGPWNMIYTDGTSLYTLYNIAEDTLLLAVSPKVSTEYWATEVSDKYGTNTEPSEKVLLHIEPLPATSQISPISIPEKICMGSTQHYWVNGTSGSTYTWKLDDVVQTSTAEFINIIWTTAGNYKLEVQEHGIRCNGEVQSGLIKVYEQPQVFAGNSIISCPGYAVKLYESTAQNFSTLHWSSSGDGTFDDVTSLQPNYIPGKNDILVGGVELTITAEGLGSGSTCNPAVSTVKVNIIKLEATVTAANVTCYGARDGTIAIVASGSGNFEFSIDGTSWVKTVDFRNLGPGIYPVQMRDLSMTSCILPIGVITITEPDPINASIRFTNATCLGNDGTITITNPQGGSGSYEYSIDGIWSNGFFNGLVPGSYLVRIRDANVPDCTAILGSIVITKPEPVTAKVSFANVSCFGGSDGSILISESMNGSGVYEFSIDGANWNPENRLPFNNLAAGNYMVMMRDFNAKSCVITLANIQITEPGQLKATAVSTNVTCYGGNDGSITIQNTAGGSGSYEFTIDTDFWKESTSFTGLVAGKYTMQMRDAQSTTCNLLIGELEITEPLQLSAKVTSADISCFGSHDGNITITDAKNGKPAYQFTIDGINWSDKGLFIQLGPGNYTVQMRDANNCTQALGSIVIVEPAPLSATVNSTNATCLGNDGTITITNPLSGSGFYEYSIDGKTWTTDGSFIGLKSNTYLVHIRDAKLTSCERTIASIIITEPEPLNATVVITNVTCFGGNDGAISISNQLGGSGIYEFSIDGINWLSAITFINLKPGNYTVQMRDARANNCLFTIGKFEITQPVQLSTTVNPTHVSCFEGNNGYLTFTKQLGGSGKYDYSMNGTDWATDKIDNLKAGIYTVRMRDAAAHNCIVSLDPVEIKQPDKIIAAVDPANVTCFGGSDGTITISKPLNGVGPYQYSLDAGTTWQTDGTFSGLTAKTFSLMVIQDANSCSAKLQTVEITQPDQLEATVTRTNETSPDASNGKISVSSQKGGSGVYQYSIDNIIWQDSPEFTSLAPKSYDVRVRDANADNCVIIKTIIILPAGSILAKTTFTDVTCYNGHDGSISFSELSGATNYEFSINGGSTWQSGAYFSGLTAQNYMLMVRDAAIQANKTELGNIQLKQPELLNATVTAGNETFAGAKDGFITITSPKGGSGEYQYSLDGTAWGSNSMFASLPSGTYNIWMQDKNAPECKVTMQKIIQPAGSLSADVVATNITCNGNKNGIINISNSSGASDYDYSIDAGTNWQPVGNFAGLSAGKYNPMLRDRAIPANKFALGEINISEPKVLEALLSPTLPLCAGTSGTVTVFARGGTGIISGTGKYDVAAGENKIFTVTDENRCMASSAYKMPAPDKITATAVIIPPKCSADNGTVTITATGGTGKYEGVETFTVQPGKAYSFKVTDSNGCTSNLINGIMPVDPAKLEATAVPANPLCFGAKGSITVTAKGGSGSYSFLWDDPEKQTVPTASGLTPGTYTVTVTDLNGCPPVKVLALVKEPSSEITVLAKVAFQPTCMVPTGTIEVTAPLGAGYEYSSDGLTYRKNPVFTGLATGNYSLKVRETATGCESPAIVLSVNPVPVVPAAPTANVSVQPNCITTTGTIKVTAPLGAAFDYSLDGISYQSNPIFTELASGTYSVKVKTIASGCESKVTTLTINPTPLIPTPPVSKGDLAECARIPLQTLNANSAIVTEAGITVLWYDKATLGNKIGSPTINITGTRIYFAEASNGVCSSTTRTPVNLSIAPIPAAPAAGVTVHPTCDFPNGTVVVSSPKEAAGFEYSIDGGAYQTSATFALLKWGEHSVRVKQTSTGCESATATLVTVNAIPPAPVLAVTGIEKSICNGGDGSISFTVANAKDGVYTIKYNGGDFQNVSITGGKAKVVAKGGTHNNLTIDANGCTSGEIVNVTVDQPSLIAINESVTEIDLKTQRKGAIDLHVIGGTGPYSYKWSNGATDEDIKNLNDGTYSVVVTDKNGCSQTKYITIPIPDFPPVAVADDYSTGCYVITGNLTANDYDPDGDFFGIDQVPVLNPLHGKLTINIDGTFEYLAYPGFTGKDIFRYAIYDQRHYLGDTARVLLQIVPDMDCDAIADDNDPDADGDGILNTDEGYPNRDTDGDGYPDYLDIDSDNDGIVDNIEAQSTAEYIRPLFVDTDGDGLDDAYDPDQKGKPITPVDTDGDGIPDFIDSDSDNDGVPDYIEGHDLNADGKADQFAIGKDSDSDGLDDAYDTVERYTTSENMTGSNAPIQDFDGDGLRDWRDDNDDDDLYLTKYEDLNADGDFSNDDTDFDGHPEYLDYGRDCDLFIPDIFTPNSDNIHDFFQVYCINHYPNAKMYLFDQTGNKIFERDHYGNLEFWGTPDRAWWNGKPEIGKGKTGNVRVSVGTYFYVLDLGNGEVRKSFVFVSY